MNWLYRPPSMTYYTNHICDKEQINASNKMPNRYPGLRLDTMTIRFHGSGSRRVKRKMPARATESHQSLCLELGPRAMVMKMGGRSCRACGVLATRHLRRRR